jgi:hypothetical protein
MKNLICIAFTLLGLVAFAQGRAPIDSLTKKRLINALNTFLIAKEKPNKENPFVASKDLPAMSALIDEMKGMDKNAKLKDPNYYRANLNNIVDLGHDEYLVQFSYMGLNDKIPLLRASFRLIAKKRDTGFYFSSPLEQHTVAWKSKKMNYITFHFKDTLNTREATAYLKFIDLCNKKLDVKAEPIDFYECNNFPEALQILGVDYKSDYNGIRFDDITSHERNTTLEITGGYTETQLFDRHDMWHDRLHMVIPVDSINRPVDEGCAYLFGGSWGKSWPQVLALFKKYAAEHPKTDWTSQYMDETNFYMDGTKPFKVSYAINALLVEKIDKDKGFAAVKELLACGKREPGDANYFKALGKIEGITTVNFNQVVGQLIREAN